MGNEASAARPYAIAAYETAVEQNAIESWAEVLACLAEASKHEMVWQLIINPNYDALVLADICIDLMKGKISEAQCNFVKLLAKADKLHLFAEIKVLFNSFKADTNKTIEVTVTSVTALSDEDKVKLEAALKNRFQREPLLAYKKDPSLLGGLLINAGDTVIDGTVKTQLQRFTEALKVGTCN